MENFDIVCKLGKGGFSKVYKVKRKIDNQIYALKKVQILNLSEKQKLSSLNEIRVLASIKNKYIINYKEAFIDEKDCSLCLVTEFADDGDLEQKIIYYKQNDIYFEEKDILKIFIQIVKGLKSLHDMGIMHRDIKSSNIFLFSNGMAKLGDLNICKILSDDNLGRTQTGTPAYAAPEVWMERPYGLKSDIWSLGCVLYEMITLKCPFREDNMVKLYNKVLVGEYKDIPNNFSDELKWILKQMINTEINNRFSCYDILNCKFINNIISEEKKNLKKKYSSEKRINEYKVKNYKNKINNNSIEKNINEEEFKQSDSDNTLLKTIYMPNNLLFLKNGLPKANYSQEINFGNISKINKSNHLDLDDSLNNDNKNKNNLLSKIKRNSYKLNIFQKNNIDNLLKGTKIKDSKSKIKLKHISSSSVIPQEINNNNRYMKDNTNEIYTIKTNIHNRKSETNLNRKIKDYLSRYEKKREKEIENNNNIFETPIKEKFNINNLKNNNIKSSDKLKQIINLKKLKQNYGNNTYFQSEIKQKNNSNESVQNNRYNNNYENNINIINNDYNELYNDKINNKNNDIKSNYIYNKNISSYIGNNANIFDNNNINTYKYKNENKFVYKPKKKKSVDILPKIKLSYN